MGQSDRHFQKFEHCFRIYPVFALLSRQLLQNERLWKMPAMLLVSLSYASHCTASHVLHPPPCAQARPRGGVPAALAPLL